MKIDLLHIYRRFDHNNLVRPIMLDAIKKWSVDNDWEANVTVGRADKVYTKSTADVVAISVYTQTARSAYRLSDMFRKEGKIVILGGPHFRHGMWKEAETHCDVVVSGVCEELWRGLLASITEKKITPNMPKAIHIEDTKGRFIYPKDFLNNIDGQLWYQSPSVPTSLGCPYSCSFCNPYGQGKYILRGIDEIYNDLANMESNFAFLSDATFGIDRKFTISLMEKIAPLKKKLLVQTTTSRLAEPGMIKALALGGVKVISVGVESVSAKFNKHVGAGVEDYRRIIIEAHDFGMLVRGDVICGLDTDGPESFEQIYDFYEKTGIDQMSPGVLVPYPGTELRRQLLSEKRIFDMNWDHYDYRHVVYQPRKMSVEQLVEGYHELCKNLYAPKIIAGKLFNASASGKITTLSALNVLFHLFNMFQIPKRKESLLTITEAKAVS